MDQRRGVWHALRSSVDSMKFSMLVAMGVLGAGVLLVGCAIDASNDEATSSEDEALSGLNHWTACSYGQTIDTFSGVSVKCDEANGHGVYQCVEYANRYASEVLHKPEIHANATDMCGVAANEGYEVFNETGTWGHHSSGHKPVKGDLLVWSGGSQGYGHVAVVSSVGSSSIEYVQQNWGWYQNGHWGQVSHSATPWYASHSFFGGTGASGSQNHYAKCWIHAPGNTPSPPPPSTDCAVGGLYCGGDKVSGDSNTLYRCEANGPQVVKHCAYGCAVHSGTDDSCKPAPAKPCVVGGLYCGGDKIVGDSNTLYRCEDHNAVQIVKHCANGCAVHAGTDDSCK
jgi:surface antigen